MLALRLTGYSAPQLAQPDSNTFSADTAGHRMAWHVVGAGSAGSAGGQGGYLPYTVGGAALPLGKPWCRFRVYEHARHAILVVVGNALMVVFQLRFGAQIKGLGNE